MYKAILLDVYGTLVRDGEVNAPICARVATLAGVEPTAVEYEWDRFIDAAAEPAYGENFRTLADLNVASLAETLTHFGLQDDAQDLWQEQLTHRPPAEVFEDVRDFLDAVNLPICLVTDADSDDLRDVLAQVGLTFEAIVTSEDARAYKPRPEPFQLALAKLGVEAADVLHIGDSPAFDIAGGNALGIDTAWVNRTGRSRPDGCVPTYQASTLTGFLPFE